MKNNTVLIALLMLFSVMTSTIAQNQHQEKQINIKFASIEEAQNILNKNDPFAKSISIVDAQIRLDKADATKEELLKALIYDVEEWTDLEQELINSCVSDIEDKLRYLNLDLRLPEEISFIKSNMQSDMEAMGFTRGTSVILFDRIVEISAESLEQLIIHELFHVITRNNPDLRKELYQIINFTVLDNEIEIPEDLKEKIISNPDVERHDSYASFTINGTPQNCMMVIYANREFEPGQSTFSYLSVGLIPLDSAHKPIVEDGKTVVYELQEAENFADVVGKNTGYVIDPEEVLADNFEIMITGRDNLPNPEIPEKIKELFLVKN